MVLRYCDATNTFGASLKKPIRKSGERVVIRATSIRLVSKHEDTLKCVYK